MELWVRSQHKGNLVKVHSIEIEARNNGDFEIWEYRGIHQVFLGEYKTKERALEVLDEIERKINDIANITDEYTVNCVYEMPKE